MARSALQTGNRPSGSERRSSPRGTLNLREQLLKGLPVTERRLKLNGVSTAVLEGGSGPPLILLHGPGTYGAAFLRIIPDLVSAYRVIAPDLPGHGLTEWFRAPSGVEQTLAWLDDLIECSTATPPDIVGHTLGGAIAARFAAARPERLRRLVLVDTFGLTPFQPAPEFGAVLMAYLAEPTAESHDRLWSRCVHDLGALQGGLGERWETMKAYNLDRARTPSVQAALQAMIEQFGGPAIPAEELARISVPTSLIWGRQDLATLLPVAEAASGRYGWPLRVIDGAADDPTIEQPEAFLAALRGLPGGPDTVVAPDETRAGWDRIAAGYDRTNTPTQMGLAAEGLRLAGLGAGQRFLDVACGSGALAIPAARLGARVVAADQSPAMLELLTVRAHRERLAIDTRLMDGQALTFAGDSFDMVGSQFGVMLFPDMPRGIREMARVTRRGGRVLLHAYGDPHQIDFLGFFIGALQAARPGFDGPPADHPPLEFQLADPERLRREFAAAGLRDITIETTTETTTFRGGEDLWDWVIWSNPIVEAMLGELRLTDGELGLVRRRLDEMVRERTGAGEVAKLTNPVHIAIGTK